MSKLIIPEGTHGISVHINRSIDLKDDEIALNSVPRLLKSRVRHFQNDIRIYADSCLPPVELYNVQNVEELEAWFEKFFPEFFKGVTVEGKRLYEPWTQIIRIETFNYEQSKRLVQQHQLWITFEPYLNSEA